MWLYTTPQSYDFFLKLPRISEVFFGKYIWTHPCRHVRAKALKIVFSFIEQCQYSLVNIVVDKDNTFLCTLNQVGHESIGIIKLTIPLAECV